VNSPVRGAGGSARGGGGGGGRVPASPLDGGGVGRPAPPLDGGGAVGPAPPLGGGGGACRGGIGADMERVCSRRVALRLRSSAFPGCSALRPRSSGLQRRSALRPRSSAIPRGFAVSLLGVLFRPRGRGRLPRGARAPGPAPLGAASTGGPAGPPGPAPVGPGGRLSRPCVAINTPAASSRARHPTFLHRTRASQSTPRQAVRRAPSPRDTRFPLLTCPARCHGCTTSCC
jgi:hypothetical protein